MILYLLKVFKWLSNATNNFVIDFNLFLFRIFLLKAKIFEKVKRKRSFQWVLLKIRPDPLHWKLGKLWKEKSSKCPGSDYRHLTILKTDFIYSKSPKWVIEFKIAFDRFSHHQRINPFFERLKQKNSNFFDVDLVRSILVFPIFTDRPIRLKERV